MGNPKAFLDIHRQEAGYRPIHDRIHDFGEVEQTLNTRERKLQEVAVWTAVCPSATGHAL
jgi:glutamate synthase (NADPH/NADH) small chain